MAESMGRVAALQQAPPPATQLSTAEQNARATQNTAVPGDVSSTQSIDAISASAKAPSGPSSSVSAEDLNAAIAELQNSVSRMSRNLEFTVDEATSQRVVKVIDAETEEVVRQIPSEEVLALAASIKEMNDAGMSVVGTLLEGLA